VGWLSCVKVVACVLSCCWPDAVSSQIR
jgi:hypothetical protein